MRVYHYDTASDTLGYSRGVPDLSAIVYEAGKITYPFMYYTSDQEPTPFYLVLYINGDTQYEATFIPDPAAAGADQLVMLGQRRLNSGRIVSESIYNLDADLLTLAAEKGLTHESTLADLEGFMDENKLAAYMTTSYEYYKNTKVVSRMSLSMQDANGVTQTASQDFDVTEKNGYYIMQPTNVTE